MAVWKCAKCGEPVQGRCKPGKCPNCGVPKTDLIKEEPPKKK